jgi:Na+/citrate or Na+/malate symporter
MTDKIMSRAISVFPFAFVLKLQEVVCKNLLKNKKVVNEIKEFNADLLVSDVVYMCGPLLQDMLDIPRVDVSPTSIVPFFMQPLQVPSPPSYTPPMGTG